MAFGLRSPLLAAMGFLFLACTTSGSGFPDAMKGVGMTGTDLHVDARLQLDGSAPDVDTPDTPPPDDVPSERTPDASTDATADRGPDTVVDAAPDGPPDGKPDAIVDTRPPSGLGKGAACGGPAECSSGFCVDGFCCDKACNGGCTACAKARTNMANGTCAAARELEGKMCGKGCGVVSGGTAVVQKVCMAGTCGYPNVSLPIETCKNDNPCLKVFCDNEAGRCVSVNACGATECCCSAAAGTRTCTARTACTGTKMCAP
jgi:hypothetical protein